MNAPHLEITKEQLLDIMQGAGEILLSYFRTNVEWHEKERNSIVTAADLASERYLVEKLTALLPVGFLAEESGIIKPEYAVGPELTGYQWVVDPLDGTTNFAAGIPYFCVSVALTLHDKPVIGCIYQPLLKEFFYATEGGGAWLNGRKIKVSNPKRIDDAVVVQAYAYSIKNIEEQADHTARIGRKVRSVRMLGAAALDTAYVAAGFIDGTLFEGTSWWDAAAGMLILHEAGGVCSEYTKTPIGPKYATFCGAGPFVYEELMKILAKKCN